MIYYVDVNKPESEKVKATHFKDAFDTANPVEMVKRLKYTKELLKTLQIKSEERKQKRAELKFKN